MAQRNLSLTAESSVRGVRTQSMSGPPTQEFVTVAVLPPRLPEDMANPTGVGTADAFAWDEAINWTHNQKIDEQKPEPTGTKKWLKKAGATRQREKANDTPPFIFRKVTYDVWRKHYAKDKEGRFRGTDTPAEDCLLLPQDVERWRLGPPETKGDQWTRGKAALPVYANAQHVEAAPAYSETAPPYSETPTEPPPVPADDFSVADVPLENQTQRTSSTFTADGRTTEQIIREAREKAEIQRQERNTAKGWKNTLKRAGEYATMGSGN